MQFYWFAPPTFPFGFNLAAAFKMYKIELYPVLVLAIEMFRSPLTPTLRHLPNVSSILSLPMMRIKIPQKHTF